MMNICCEVLNRTVGRTTRHHTRSGNCRILTSSKRRKLDTECDYGILTTRES